MIGRVKISEWVDCDGGPLEKVLSQVANICNEIHVAKVATSRRRIT